MSVSVGLRVEDQAVLGVMARLRALGANPASLMADLAALGENTTRERFRTQIDPQGNRWKPSLRARLTGGKTLTKDGHLANSITHRSTSNMAQWGTNRIYGVTHQLGLTIKAKSGGKLRFALAGGGWATVAQVDIPQREFLGLSDMDREDMLDIAKMHIEELING